MKKPEKKKKIEDREKFNKSFSRMRYSYGVVSTLTVIFIIGFLMFVNLVVDRLAISFDMTENRMFSISDATKNFLRGLDKEITIYTLFPAGYEIDYLQFQEMLNEYSSASSKVTVTNRDPYFYRGFVDSHAQKAGLERISPFSVIIEGPEIDGARKTRVVDYRDFFRETTNIRTGERYYEFEFEARITNAIAWVNREQDFIAYETVGNGQTPLSASFIRQLNDAGFEVRMYDSRFSPVPGDCDVLIITTPTGNDFADYELKYFEDYFQHNAGRGLFLISPGTRSYPNLNAIIEGYGIQVSNAYVYEGDGSRFIDAPSMIIPHITAHEINMSYNSAGRHLVFFNAFALRELEFKRADVTILPLLTTSRQSYAKTGGDMRSFEKEPGDEEGPFTIGFAAEERYFTHDGVRQLSRVVVIGSELIVADNFANAAYLNRTFLISSLYWLINASEIEIADIVSIPITDTPVVLVTAAQSNTIKFVIWFFVPVAVVAVGVFVWLRRRAL
jgi:hypothetical protein